MKKVAIALIVVLLVLGTVSPVLASASTIWKLDSETVTGDESGYEMERSGGSGDDGQTGSVTITQGKAEFWVSDEAAQADVTFNTASWTVELYRSDTSSAHHIAVEIGAYDGTFSPQCLPHDVWFGAGNASLSFNVGVDSFTVNSNEYVGIKINNSEPFTPLTIVTTGDSSVTYPPAVPAYPIPELATIILLVGGLGVLATYLILQRRKRSYQRV